MIPPDRGFTEISFGIISDEDFQVFSTASERDAYSWPLNSRGIIKFEKKTGKRTSNQTIEFIIGQFGDPLKSPSIKCPLAGLY